MVDGGCQEMEEGENVETLVKGDKVLVMQNE